MQIAKRDINNSADEGKEVEGDSMFHILVEHAVSIFRLEDGEHGGRMFL
jgi:hypothetical protein